MSYTCGWHTCCMSTTLTWWWMAIVCHQQHNGTSYQALFTSCISSYQYKQILELWDGVCMCVCVGIESLHSHYVLMRTLHSKNAFVLTLLFKRPDLFFLRNALVLSARRSLTFRRIGIPSLTTNKVQWYNPAVLSWQGIVRKRSVHVSSMFYFTSSLCYSSLAYNALPLGCLSTDWLLRHSTS